LKRRKAPGLTGASQCGRRARLERRRDRRSGAFCARIATISDAFIEYMPLDSVTNGTRKSSFRAGKFSGCINEVFPLVLKQKSRGSETAWKYSFADGAPGEIGIIAPVTEMFCGACSRIRLTADGQIRTCLFSTQEHNLRDCLRSGATRAEIGRIYPNRSFFKKNRAILSTTPNSLPARAR
jgi:molybdenum cofactor biosynthesis enzyme MoaA